MVVGALVVCRRRCRPPRSSHHRTHLCGGETCDVCRHGCRCLLEDGAGFAHFVKICVPLCGAESSERPASFTIMCVAYLYIGLKIQRTVRNPQVHKPPLKTKSDKQNNQNHSNPSLSVACEREPRPGVRNNTIENQSISVQSVQTLAQSALPVRAPQRSPAGP